MILTMIIGFALTAFAIIAPMLLPGSTELAPNPLLTAIVGVGGTGFLIGWQVALHRLQESVQAQEVDS